MPVSARRSDLLHKRLDLFTRALQGIEDGDVRALHRTRVASRRLRELLPILQLEQSSTRKLIRRLRRITNRLGSVRELDVLLMVLDELRAGGQSSAKTVRLVTEAVADEREDARKHLLEKLPVAELRRVAEKLDGAGRELDGASGADARRQETACRWAVDARIARRAERLLETMREAGAVYLPDRLHVVRVALKKLRYAMELRAELAGERQNGDLRRLKRAQDFLGRMHDLQLLMDRIRRVQAALAPADITAWDDFDELLDRLEDECRRLHGRYMRERPALSALCMQSIGRPRAVAARRAG